MNKGRKTLVTTVDGSTMSPDKSCANEVKEELEDGEIVDEDDTEMGVTTDLNTKSTATKRNCFGENSSDNDFDTQWEMKQPPHKNMILHGVSSMPFTGFNNEMPRHYTFPKNNLATTKRAIGCNIMNENRPDCKRQRFDQVNENYSMFRNNQNVIFSITNNDTPLEFVEGEMLEAGKTCTNVSNIVTFRKEFDKVSEDSQFTNNNLRQMGKWKQGKSGKRQMAVGHLMKKIPVENKEQIRQNFHQGKYFQNTFNFKSGKKKIPSLLDIKIPIPPKFKMIKEDPESNNTISNNNSTPMSLLLDGQTDATVGGNFEVNKLDTLKHPVDDLTIGFNDYSLLNDLSDDNTYNDLVIDEDRFDEDEKDPQPPKKQIELLNEIQVLQKCYNKTTMKESSDNQEEQHSSVVSDSCVFAPIVLNSSKSKEEKERFTTSFLASSNVGKVHFAQTASDGSSKDENISPFILQPLEQQCDLNEIIQEEKYIVEESSPGSTNNISDVMNLERSDVDFRQLPLQFLAVSTEIDASLDSHPPIKYQMFPTQISKTDYFDVPPIMGVDDPRLRRYVQLARNPMFWPNVFTTNNAVVRSDALHKSRYS